MAVNHKVGGSNPPGGVFFLLFLHNKMPLQRCASGLGVAALSAIAAIRNEIHVIAQSMCYASLNMEMALLQVMRRNWKGWWCDQCGSGSATRPLREKRCVFNDIMPAMDLLMVSYGAAITIILWHSLWTSPVFYCLLCVCVCGLFRKVLLKGNCHISGWVAKRSNAPDSRVKSWL